MNVVSEKFKTVEDKRRSNSSYQLADSLKSGFAMFSLKCPSLLSFKEQSKNEKLNLKSIYKIKKIPSDTAMREILDEVEPEKVRESFGDLFNLLIQSGLIKEYQYFDKQIIVSVDGVEHFSSTKIHCESCTTKTHRNGEVSYHHSALAAVVVHPGSREVFPLDFEPILRTDGVKKNDCERNAAKRLCERLHLEHPGLEVLLVEDALYANAPHIRQIRGYGWLYILNVKPDSHKALFAHFEGRPLPQRASQRI